eukprot:tig00020927_g15984.t1
MAVLGASAQENSACFFLGCPDTGCVCNSVGSSGLVVASPTFSLADELAAPVWHLQPGDAPGQLNLILANNGTGDLLLSIAVAGLSYNAQPPLAPGAWGMDVVSMGAAALSASGEPPVHAPGALLAGGLPAWLQVNLTGALRPGEAGALAVQAAIAGLVAPSAAPANEVAACSDANETLYACSPSLLEAWDLSGTMPPGLYTANLTLAAADWASGAAVASLPLLVRLYVRAPPSAHVPLAWTDDVQNRGVRTGWSIFDKVEARYLAAFSEKQATNLMDRNLIANAVNLTDPTAGPMYDYQPGMMPAYVRWSVQNRAADGAGALRWSIHGTPRLYYKHTDNLTFVADGVPLLNSFEDGAGDPLPPFLDPSGPARCAPLRLPYFYRRMPRDGGIEWARLVNWTEAALTGDLNGFEEKNIPQPTAVPWLPDLTVPWFMGGQLAWGRDTGWNPNPIFCPLRFNFSDGVERPGVPGACRPSAGVFGAMPYLVMSVPPGEAVPTWGGEPTARRRPDSEGTLGHINGGALPQDMHALFWPGTAGNPMVECHREHPGLYTVVVDVSTNDPQRPRLQLYLRMLVRARAEVRIRGEGDRGEIDLTDPLAPPLFTFETSVAGDKRFQQGRANITVYNVPTVRNHFGGAHIVTLLNNTWEPTAYPGAPASTAVPPGALRATRYSPTLRFDAAGRVVVSDDRETDSDTTPFPFLGTLSYGNSTAMWHLDANPLPVPRPYPDWLLVGKIPCQARVCGETATALGTLTWPGYFINEKYLQQSYEDVVEDDNRFFIPPGGVWRAPLDVLGFFMSSTDFPLALHYQRIGQLDLALNRYPGLYTSVLSFTWHDFDALAAQAGTVDLSEDYFFVPCQWPRDVRRLAGPGRPWVRNNLFEWANTRMFGGRTEKLHVRMAALPPPVPLLVNFDSERLMNNLSSPLFVLRQGSADEAAVTITVANVAKHPASTLNFTLEQSRHDGNVYRQWLWYASFGRLNYTYDGTAVTLHETDWRRVMPSPTPTPSVHSVSVLRSNNGAPTYMPVSLNMGSIPTQPPSGLTAFGTYRQVTAGNLSSASNLTLRFRACGGTACPTGVYTTHWQLMADGLRIAYLFIRFAIGAPWVIACISSFEFVP